MTDADEGEILTLEFLQNWLAKRRETQKKSSRKRQGYTAKGRKGAGRPPKVYTYTELRERFLRERASVRQNVREWQRNKRSPP